MKPYRDPNRTTYKLRIVLGDRRRNCSCGTASLATARAITRFVQLLFDERRWPILEAILDGMVTLGQAYDQRNDLAALLARLNDPDLEPYVAEWHAEKATARKGGKSADRYERQVRRLVAAGNQFPRSRFTRLTVDAHLRGLKVDDPTRNRHRAALMSFAKYLVRRSILPTNVVRDVEGWSEGAGRVVYMERDEAQRVIAGLEQPFQALEALMCGAGLEWQAIAALRARDVDLNAGTVLANGEKTGWRRRLCRIVEPWCVPFIRPALAARLPAARLFEGVSHHRALAAHRAACKAVEAPESTLHDWRHTHAVLMLRSGYKPTVVAHQLGHRDTTLVWKRYGRFAVDERDYVLGKDEIPVPVPPTAPPTLTENVK